MVRFGRVPKLFVYCHFGGYPLLPIRPESMLQLLIDSCKVGQSFSPPRCNGEIWQGTQIIRLLSLWCYPLLPIRPESMLQFMIERCNIWPKFQPSTM